MKKVGRKSKKVILIFTLIIIIGGLLYYFLPDNTDATVRRKCSVLVEATQLVNNGNYGMIDGPGAMMPEKVGEYYLTYDNCLKILSGEIRL